MSSNQEEGEQAIQNTFDATTTDVNEEYFNETQPYDETINEQNDLVEPTDFDDQQDFNIDLQTDLFKEIHNIFLGQLNFDICYKLEDLVNRDYLKIADLNEALIESLKDLNNTCLILFDEYIAQIDQNKTVEQTEPINNGALLIEKIINWKKLNNFEPNNEIQQINSLNNNKQQRPGPEELKLKEILDRTGYSHEVSSGQRKYGGPPPDLNTEIQEEEKIIEETVQIEADKAKSYPPPGCECFVGKLPKDLFEDELIPVFEKVGRIWDLRLMIDPNTGYSKGYCFVTYCNKESTHEAAKTLNNYQIRPGKEIIVNVSVANVRLFIGNIPKIKTKEELKEEFSKLVEGVNEVIIYNPGESSDNDKLKNRGFCFIEFLDHKTASMAKRKLSSLRFNRIFSRELAVDWADPNEEPDEETMSKVKVLFIKNISAEVTEEEVQKLFEQYGKLERVRKMKDYAFVHFEQREDAVKAMQEQQSIILGKTPIEINLARPLTDKKKQAQQKRNQNGNVNMNPNNNNGYRKNNNFNNQRQLNNRNFNNNDQFEQSHFGQNRNMNRSNNRNNGRFNNGNNFNQNNFNSNRPNQQANFANKRKNDSGSYINEMNKKGRFNQESFNGLPMDQQFMSNFNQFNDNGSNEWYQDNFNSNQWI